MRFIGYAATEPLDAQQSPIRLSLRAISPAVMSLCHNSVLELSSPKLEVRGNSHVMKEKSLTVYTCNVDASLV